MTELGSIARAGCYGVQIVPSSRSTCRISLAAMVCTQTCRGTMTSRVVQNSSDDPAGSCALVGWPAAFLQASVVTLLEGIDSRLKAERRAYTVVRPKRSRSAFSTQPPGGPNSMN
jgi:hypothetical protein